MDVTITANALARYVPALRVADDDFRLRIVLHDLGMLAMKVRAARSSDIADTRLLLAANGLSCAEDAVSVVESVFPGESLGPRQRRRLEDVLDDLVPDT